MSTDGPPPELIARLAVLLKHTSLRYAEVAGAALEPYGIAGRELGVLTVLDSKEPLSQQQAAARLAIDRTTMVAMIDVLEDKGLVARLPDPADRRKNIVALTPDGTRTLRAATRASLAAERRFLAPLGADAQRLKDMLATLLTQPTEESRSR